LITIFSVVTKAIIKVYLNIVSFSYKGLFLHVLLNLITPSRFGLISKYYTSDVIYRYRCAGWWTFLCMVKCLLF